MLLRNAMIGSVLCVATMLFAAGARTHASEKAPHPTGTCGHADPTRTITVIGEGQVQTEPDVAKANVGVRVTASTVRNATSQNKKKMVAVLDALRRAGVAKADMQTSNYSIHYEPPRPEPTPRDRGGEKATEGRYHVSNMVAVTIRDMDKVDAVLEAVTEAGANQIWGVRFSVDKPENLASEARRLAAAQAREKAEELAALHNVHLGPVVSISEAIGPGPAPVARAHMEMARGGPIVPGEVSFTARLQVTYGIRK
jgi:uncharacterized protein YggE